MGVGEEHQSSHGREEREVAEGEVLCGERAKLARWEGERIGRGWLEGGETYTYREGECVQ